MIWCNLFVWELFNFIRQSIWIGCDTIAWMVGWLVSLIKANHQEKRCVHNSLKRINCTKFPSQTSLFPFSGSEICYSHQKETIPNAISVSLTAFCAYVFMKCVNAESGYKTFEKWAFLSLTFSWCVYILWKWDGKLEKTSRRHQFK